MNIKEQLSLYKKVKNLIISPEKWTKRSFARTTEGLRVAIDDENASCFCLVGAFAKFSVSHTIGVNILYDLISKKNHFDIISFNDSGDTKHEDVISVLDEAISICEEKIRDEH